MADPTPQVRLFGLDTCNQVAGPDGALPDDQFRWLQDQLARAQAERKLAIVLSHHNSLTLENRAQRPGADQVLHGAEEVVDLLLDHPVAVAWRGGHTHLNQILAHTRGSTGFWEITTASCIDFPQQQQVVELVDNRDGTTSLFTAVVDHASPIAASAGSADLAATSASSPPTTGSRTPSCAADRRWTATPSCCCPPRSTCRRSRTPRWRRSRPRPARGCWPTTSGLPDEAAGGDAAGGDAAGGGAAGGGADGGGAVGGGADGGGADRCAALGRAGAVALRTVAQRTAAAVPVLAVLVLAAGCSQAVALAPVGKHS